MTTRVAIHQPNYLPYLGFFHKMSLVDIFVLYDTAQFAKNDFHNRNRIKTPAGPVWLTIPVRRPEFKPIGEIVIAGEGWADKHWKSVEANYSRAAYFGSYRDDLRRVLARPWTKLAAVNEALIDFLGKAFGIQTKIVLASGYPPLPSVSASARLATLVRAAGGDTYVSGMGGVRYVDPTAFGQTGLFLQDFRHPEYRQLWGGFNDSLSALDLLLNEGDRGADIIARSGGLVPWPS